MNKNVIEIIDALGAHQDSSSIGVLEELGTNSPDNEVREYTSRAVVRKNVHDSLAVVIINQGKGINDLSPSVAMSTINEILSLKDKTEVIKILDDTINMHSDEGVKENHQTRSIPVSYTGPGIKRSGYSYDKKSGKGRKEKD